MEEPVVSTLATTHVPLIHDVDVVHLTEIIAAIRSVWRVCHNNNAKASSVRTADS